jgi:hypothetical protein
VTCLWKEEDFRKFGKLSAMVSYYSAADESDEGKVVGFRERSDF